MNDIDNVGFISLHRSLRKWRWYGVPNMISVWIELLLTASFKDTSYKNIDIKRGQVIFGRKKFAERLGLSEQQVRTCITRLKSTNEITMKTTNKFSIITIVNWDYYQVLLNTNNQQVNQQNNMIATSNQPTTNQQLTTYNNVNKVNKVNNVNNIPSNLNSNINTMSELFVEEFKRELSKEEHLQVNAMCSFYGTKLVEYALRESVIYDQVNFPYIVSILRRWKADGMTPEKYENGES